MRQLAIYLLLGLNCLYSQHYWKASTPIDEPAFAHQKGIKNPLLFTLDARNLKQYLSSAQNALSHSPESLKLSFPDEKGRMQTYHIYEYSNFEKDLQLQFPEIRAYVGFQQDNPYNRVRFSYSPKGLSAMIKRADQPTLYIEPYSDQYYAVYTSHTYNENLPAFECTTESKATTPSLTLKSNVGEYKTFRIAISTDGEYTQFHGGTIDDALAAINTTLSRVNGLYEVDLGVHLNLVNNTSIIFTDPDTDPYSGNANAELQNTLTNWVGESNYDIGHLFSANGSGGNAGCIGCICEDGIKGSAYTASSSPIGDSFDIDYVAHEIGHQLGGNHTFSYSNWENFAYNVEPGSGSTIMAYAGITGQFDVQAHSDDYFVYTNIEQIQNNLATKNCAITTSISNQTPILNPFPLYHIPKGTAFKLTGFAQDDQVNALTYCWEQNDDANATAIGLNSFPSPTKVSGPNFRSLPPSTSPTRYFPNFQSVLEGNLCTQWECISEVSRSLQFACTVRDNQVEGQTQTQLQNLLVDHTAGPFLITSPNGLSEVPAGGTLHVQWDTANTQNSPVNCQSVNISLSTDGGQNFVSLIENTPNDGSEVLNLSGISAATDCYLMVEAADNVFYTLSENFLLGYSVEENCETYPYTGSAITIPDNTDSFDSIAEIIVGPAASGALISDVNAQIEIEHSYVSDLKIIIESPSATSNVLWDYQCNGETNLQVTFDDQGNEVNCNSPVLGTITPIESLSVYNNETQAGIWKIKIGDFYAQDVGIFLNGSLQICSRRLTPLSIDDIEPQTQEFSLVPQPANDYISIHSDLIFIKYNIYDLSGKMLQSSSLDTNNIATDTLISGTYILQLQTEEGKWLSQKFLKD